MIIVEGPDNAGKSTFAAKIGLQVRHPGPAPINEFELNLCLHDQMIAMREPIVLDRVSCISHQVYNEGWFNSDVLWQYLNEFIKSKHVIFVYCRPPESQLMNFAHHKAKDYDTEAHIQRVIDNQATFIRRYDELFSKIPHIAYDFTDAELPKSHIIRELVHFAHGQPSTIKDHLIGGRI